MNKTTFYFFWLNIKLNFYKLLCLINIHPKKNYDRSYPTYNKTFNKLNQNCKIIDMYKCKICNKIIQNERL